MRRNRGSFGSQVLLLSPTMLMAAVAVVALFATGCGPDDGPDGVRDRAGQTGGQSLTLVAYNAGLAHGAVALAAERLPLLPGALKQTGADILCLEEVWTDADYATVRAALADTFPHAFRQKTEDDSWRSIQCNPWNVYWLDRCVSKSCTPQGISAEECVSGPCQAEYDKLSDGCQRCLAANTASPSNCAIWGAKAYTSEGRNGLALFSRRPLERPRYTAFDTILVKRGVITAAIDGMIVQCTHLSSDLKVVPYPTDRRFAGWQEEQLAQLDVLDTAAAAASDRGGPCRVVLGDLNTGPAAPGIKAEVPETYQALLDRGFAEPVSAPRCTWCQDNPLAGAKDALWLDHIMFQGCDSGMQVSYSRVLDQPLQVTSGKTTLTTRLSDHYGIAARLEPAY